MYSGFLPVGLISLTGLSPCLAGLPRTVLLSIFSFTKVLTPDNSGLGSSDFARRYFRNHCYFLFLWVLRCFSSPRSLCITMDSLCSDRGVLCQVSPFGNLRIVGYLLLTAAYRSLSRPSSALSAKASALRSCLLNLLKVLNSHYSSSTLPSVAALQVLFGISPARRSQANSRITFTPR